MDNKWTYKGINGEDVPIRFSLDKDQPLIEIDPKWARQAHIPTRLPTATDKKQQDNTALLKSVFAPSAGWKLPPAPGWSMETRGKPLEPPQLKAPVAPLRLAPPSSYLTGTPPAAPPISSSAAGQAPLLGGRAQPLNLLHTAGYTGNMIGQGVQNAGRGFSNAVKGEVAASLDVENTFSQLEKLGIPRPQPVNAEGAQQNQAMLAQNKAALEKSILNSAQQSRMERAAIEAKYPTLPQYAKTAGQLVGTVGQVAPVMAASAISPLTGMQMLYGMASGNEMAEALQAGADIHSAKKAGIASGISEITIEKLFGGIPMLGNGAISPDDLVRRYINSPSGQAIAKAAFNALGEGAEEVASEVLAPFIKRAYYDPNAPMPTMDELAMAFGGGAVAAAILGGANEIVQYNAPLAKAERADSIKLQRIEMGYNRLSKGVLGAEGTQRAPLFPLGPNATPEMIARRAAQQNAVAGGKGGVSIRTPAMQKTIAEYQAAVDTDMVDFIAKARENPKSNWLQYSFGNTSERTANDIKALTGIDVSGFGRVIRPNSIEHIDNRHGANGLADKSMESDENISRMRYVMDNYDNIELVVDDSSAEHKDSSNQPSPLVRLKKRINGTYYVVEAVPDNKQRNIQIVSAYIESANSRTKKEALQVPGAGLHPSEPTAEPSLHNASFDPTIAQGNNGVNTQSMQNFGQNTVGAAQHNPASYSGMITDHGVIEPGENPARQVDVPRKNAQGKLISKVSRTIMEAGVTTDEGVGIMERMIESGELTNETVTNKAAMKHATDTIEYEGFAGALSVWNSAVRSGKVDKNMIALGQTIYNQAIQNHDIPLVKKMVSDLVLTGSESGRSLQAQRMLKKMTPDGQLYYLQQSLQKINRETAERYDGKFGEIEIPDSLTAELLNSTDDAGRDVAVENIQQYIADRMPSTWFDKWNAWRYMAMLGNPKTHLRNIVGNGIFYPAVKIKNAIATVLESGTNMGLKVLGKEGIQRTKAITFDKETRSFAKADAQEMETVLRGGGKMNPTDAINDKRRIFTPRVAPKLGLNPNISLEGARKLNNWALDAEDWVALRLHYVDSLSSYMAANGLTAAQMGANTKESNAALNAARAYAVSEAQKGTFRDASAVANVLNSAKRNLMKGNLGSKGAGILLEGAVPFTKTPVNILKRGVEYSPAGLAKGLTYDLAKVKSGDMTAAQAIDHIAAGLTGTGIIAIGMWLASMGLISGAGSDDKKERDFDRMTGEQDYALQLGDTSYTIDWAAPVAIPLFVGVELEKMRQKDGNYSFADSVNALTTIADPITDMSMLQGINRVIKAAQYGDNPIGSMGTELFTGYLGQGVPTLAGQVARTIDPVRRSTYIDKNSQLPKMAQTFLQKNMAKIPFVSTKLTPYIDPWGREQHTEGAGQRALGNFASPGYISKDKSTPLDKEIKRLYEQNGNSDLLPSYAPKDITVEGKTKNFTAKEYQEYATDRGQTAFKVASDVVASNVYKRLDTEQKESAILAAYTYAEEKAKSDASTYKLTGKSEDIYRAKAAGLKESDYILVLIQADRNHKGGVSKDELEAASLTRMQKRYIWEAQGWETDNPY